MYLFSPCRRKSDIDRYFGLLNNLTERVLQSYHGFRIRIYHNISQQEYKPLLCKTYCDNPHLDFCNVTKLKEDHKLSHLELGKSFKNGMFWRFLPLGDPTVKLFYSRDIDSFILDREVS